MPPEIDDQVEEPVEEIKEVVAEETETEEPVTESRTEKILQSISEKLDKAPAKESGPSPEQIKAAWREQIKKETNMTDQQIDYMENRLQAVVAPLYADQTYVEWKNEKVNDGIEITDEIEKGVKEYLKGYDPRVRNDKTLLDNVLYMEIGKRAAKKKPVAVASKESEEASEITGRPKIVPQTPAPAASLAGGVKKAGAASLTPEEKMIARKMRMTEDEYASAKSTAIISELKRK